MTLIDISEKIAIISEESISNLQFSEEEIEKLRIGHTQYILDRFNHYFPANDFDSIEFDSLDQIKPEFHKAYLLASIDFLYKISATIAPLQEKKDTLQKADQLQLEISEILERIPS